MELPWENLYVNMKEANKDNLVNFNIIEDDVEISQEIITATGKNHLKVKREYNQLHPLNENAMFQGKRVLNKQFKFK